MYLEISPRRTGKTTRLIEAMKSALKCGYAVYFMSPNYRMFKDMMQRFGMNTSYVTYIVDGAEFTEKTRGTDIRGQRLFFDEFEFIDNERLVFSESGYYVSSLKRTRTITDVIRHRMEERFDPFIQLMDMNGGRYESYSITNMLDRMTVGELCNLKRQMSHESFDIEICNRVMK